MASKMDTARNDTKVKKDMACKMTEAKLSALFNVTYYTRLCRDHLKPLLTGFKAGLLNDLPPQDNDMLCNHFSALITRTPSTAATLPVPPIVEQLFATLEDIPSTINLFTNGAGKSFMANLLLLPRGRGSQYHVRVSTTNNPHKDWCGLVCDELTGMADLLVCSGAQKLVVGEVKGPKDNADGFFQCVGWMQIIKKKTNTWPLGKSGFGAICVLHLPPAPVVFLKALASTAIVVM